MVSSRAMVTGANCLSLVVFYTCRLDTLLYFFTGGYMEGTSAVAARVEEVHRHLAYHRLFIVARRPGCLGAF